MSHLASGPLSAQEVKQPMGKAEKADKAEKFSDPWAEKKYKFDKNGQSWDKVLAWLTELTGKNVVSSWKPTGSLTLLTPMDAKFSIYEIIDLLNEGLLANEATQKYVLINRSRSFTLVPASEKIDPVWLEEVKPEDLERHGANEMVRTIIALKTLVAEDISPDLKKLLGPFGEVSSITSTNQLYLQDTAGNLIRLRDMILKLEKEETGNTQTYKHECKYIQARDAMAILKTLMGDPKDVLGGAADANTGNRGPGGRGGNPQPQFPNFGAFDPMAAMNPNAGRQAVIVPKLRMHYIAMDESHNTVLVTGPANKIAEAKKILTELDIQKNGQKPVVSGDPILRTYNVPTGNSENIVKAIIDAYKLSPNVRILPSGTNSIIVYAGPEDHLNIGKLIGDGTENGASTISYDVGAQDATKIASQLKDMFGNISTGGSVFISADADQNKVVVRGSKAQLADVKGGP